MTLDHNIATSQRRDVERSQNPKPLSRRDVGRPYFVPLSVSSRRWPQRRDVRFQHARERRNVSLKDSRERRDVDTSIFWNVATLVLYSRERCDVGPECCDVSPVFMNIKCSFSSSSDFLEKP